MSPLLAIPVSVLQERNVDLFDNENLKTACSQLKMFKPMVTILQVFNLVIIIILYIRSSSGRS
jgi:hypothetical protein